MNTKTLSAIIVFTITNSLSPVVLSQVDFYNNLEAFFAPSDSNPTPSNSNAGQSSPTPSPSRTQPSSIFSNSNNHYTPQLNYPPTTRSKSGENTAEKEAANMLDMNSWSFIPNSLFTSSYNPSHSSSQPTNSPSSWSFQGDASYQGIPLSNYAVPASEGWDYSSNGLDTGQSQSQTDSAFKGENIGAADGGGAQAFLPLADHSPGSITADSPDQILDWSSPPISKDTYKYDAEPTQKPDTVYYDGESMAKAILKGHTSRWQWNYGSSLGSSSGNYGRGNELKMPCCQRLPYICGVDGMCVIEAAQCNEFCSCAANPYTMHCIRMIPKIKKTMITLEQTFLAKMAKVLNITTPFPFTEFPSTTTSTTTTTTTTTTRKPTAMGQDWSGFVVARPTPAPRTYRTTPTNLAVQVTKSTTAPTIKIITSPALTPTPPSTSTSTLTTTSSTAAPSSNLPFTVSISATQAITFSALQSTETSSKTIATSGTTTVSPTTTTGTIPETSSLLRTSAPTAVPSTEQTKATLPITMLTTTTTPPILNTATQRPVTPNTNELTSVNTTITTTTSTNISSPITPEAVPSTTTTFAATTQIKRHITTLPTTTASTTLPTTTVPGISTILPVTTKAPTTTTIISTAITTLANNTTFPTTPAILPTIAPATVTAKIVRQPATTQLPISILIDVNQEEDFLSWLKEINPKPQITTATLELNETTVELYSPCNKECSSKGGTCVMGNDFRPHCVIVEDDACENFYCINGECVSTDGFYKCECSEGWTGIFCDQSCSLDCGEHGYCDVLDNNETLVCICHWNYTGYRCEDKRKIIPLVTEVSVPGDDFKAWEVAVVAVTTAILLALICVLLPYILWRRQWLPIRQLVFFFQEYEDKDDKLYDAFVSYKSTPRDERFVLHHLFAKLEKEMNFRLCLHFRDFPPGEPIANNIIHAVENSRRTIMVLSPSYVASEWCRMEYQKAQYEMLKLKHKIIPIVLEDVHGMPNMDKNLKTIIDTVTYIKWPGEDKTCTPKVMARFWKLLELSMPKLKADGSQCVDSTGSSLSEVALKPVSKTKTCFNSLAAVLTNDDVISSSMFSNSSSSRSGNSYNSTSSHNLTASSQNSRRPSVELARLSLIGGLATPVSLTPPLGSHRHKNESMYLGSDDTDGEISNGSSVNLSGMNNTNSNEKSPLSFHRKSVVVADMSSKNSPEAQTRAIPSSDDHIVEIREIPGTNKITLTPRPRQYAAQLL